MLSTVKCESQVKTQVGLACDEILTEKGAILWNNLPANIKSADGINNFNALIKKYDFESLKFDKLASLISFKDSMYEYF